MEAYPMTNNNQSSTIKSRTYSDMLAFVKNLKKESLNDTDVIARLSKDFSIVPPNYSRSYLDAITDKTGIRTKEILDIITGNQIEANDQHSLKPVSAFATDFTYPNLLLPTGYTLEFSPSTGTPIIVSHQGKTPIVVIGVAAVPTRLYLPKAGAALDRPELYQLTRFNQITHDWEDVPQLFKRSLLSGSRNILDLADAGFSVGSTNASELSKFFHQFIEINATKFEMTETINRFGWVKNKTTDEKSFAPFSGDYTVVPSSGDLAENGYTSNDFEKVKQIAGTREEALKIVHELKDNMVFLSMLSGVLAGPVVHLIHDYLQEGIGIDLSGKTSKGKTSIQKLVFNLVYGDSSPFVRSWEGATANGIWGIANKANHLPFILDDSHHISKSTYHIPHALINGKQGDKMRVSKNTNEIDLRNNNTVSTVILFNGEVRLSDQSLIDNSRGLLGRVIMIQELPFSSKYSSEQVSGYVQRSKTNRGQFRDQWLAYLAQLDPETIIDQVSNTTQLFDFGDSSSVYSRLAKKASTLYWSLHEANKVLKLGLDISPLIPFLIKHMKETVTNADIIEDKMRKLVDYVIQHSSPGESCHPLTQSLLREGYNNEDDDFFLLKKDAIKKILEGTLVVDSFLNELVREGYLTTAKSTKKSFVTETGKSTSTSGYEFNKQVIREKLALDVDIPVENASIVKQPVRLVQLVE